MSHILEIISIFLFKTSLFIRIAHKLGLPALFKQLPKQDKVQSIQLKIKFVKS